MLKKHFILLAFALGITFLYIATLFYPGGSVVNPSSIGFYWNDNYISNLLNPIAVNGMDNPARPWAVAGTFVLSAGFGFFFVRFSEYIKVKSAAFIIKYVGGAAAFFAFLTAIPTWHDPMVTLSAISMLLVFFYLTVMAFKSNLFWLKCCSVLFLTSFYVAMFMYNSRIGLEWLPMMQKFILAAKITWVLSLVYFTKKEDFERFSSSVK